MDHLLVVLLLLWSSGVQCETTAKADIVLLLDESGSISQSDFKIMRSFAASTVNAFHIGPDRVQIGMVKYSDVPRAEWQLNTYQTKQSLLEAIDHLIQTGGGTMTGLALSFILHHSFKPNKGMRAGSKKIAILITDGESHDDIDSPSWNLKDAGIEVYAIGVSRAIESELRSIASDPDKIHTYIVDNFLLLPNIVDNLIINICNSLVSVRLVNGTSQCSGRLEVKSDQSDQSDQSWSSVCEDGFDQQDAEVVCRELGCGAPSVLQGALYGEVEGLMWTENFQCGGHESALLDCRSSGSASNNCSAGKAVGLTCSEPFRLVGGDSRCAGTLEVKLGEWRPVYGSHWTLKAAAAVCRELDCGSAVSTGMRKKSLHKSDWEISSNCIQSGSALRGCVSSGSSPSIMEITCSVSVRLVNGTSLCSGRLEVKSNQSDQSWSSVCEDGFDQQDAEVVCRELGCGAPSVLQGALYGEVEGLMWTENFQCGGHESALLDCRSSGSASNNCSAGKAVGLTCSEPFRLVGGDSRCAGTLEVKLGEWRPVYGSYWTLKAAAIVCRELDCGSAVSTRRRYQSSKRSAWISSDCVQSGSALRECVSSLSWSSSIMEFTCSVHGILKGGEVALFLEAHCFKLWLYVKTLIVNTHLCH
ncbi:scavenger receptor cysteine-rich type 1 protein M130-like [Enoplosus armatus]|uniref:scavenger receptor cysteine-rich type 1 protein M130-like n=1 Tax=Enoplosus armatus TaxID=215367 RepID=UPI003993A379